MSEPTLAPVHTLQERRLSSALPPQGLKSTMELTIVIPTYNERENIQPLLQALELALPGTEWEAIFVDDNSPDGTGREILALAAANPRVRLIERFGRRGLSSACIEGMLAASAPFIAVMDADLQHDERALPEMLRRIRSGQLDLVVASRRSKGASVGEFAKVRDRLSILGARVSRLVCRAELSDPMSGFFLVDREFFNRTLAGLSGTGFKILVDLVASSRRSVRIAEVPYRFRSRHSGKSKFGVRAELEYLHLIVTKYAGRFMPVRAVAPSKAKTWLLISQSS